MNSDYIQLSLFLSAPPWAHSPNACFPLHVPRSPGRPFQRHPRCRRTRQRESVDVAAHSPPASAARRLHRRVMVRTRLGLWSRLLFPHRLALEHQTRPWRDHRIWLVHPLRAERHSEFATQPHHHELDNRSGIRWRGAPLAAPELERPISCGTPLISSKATSRPLFALRLGPALARHLRLPPTC